MARARLLAYGQPSLPDGAHRKVIPESETNVPIPMSFGKTAPVTLLPAAFPMTSTRPRKLPAMTVKICRCAGR